MTDIGNMKPRQFVREFQKRAGLLIDGVAGPQTRMALWFIPEMPPGRLYPPIPELPEHLRPKADAPTPIDPADIRPGDVVEARQVHTAWSVDERHVWVSESTGLIRDWFTWHLVHRPDPDAEAVEALLTAGLTDDANMIQSDTARIARRYLANLREQGFDVVRRAES